MTAKVVHVFSDGWRNADPDKRRYIGRAMTLADGRRLDASEWANPYKLKHEAMRGPVLAQYEKWLRAKLKDHAGKIAELRALIADSEVLGCWCKANRYKARDRACHGDILVAVGTMDDERLFDWLTGRFSVLDGNSETR